MGTCTSSCSLWLADCSSVHTVARNFVPFCPGETWYNEWDCCSSMEPPRKERKDDRLLKPISPFKMQDYCDGDVHKNTQKATDWALRLFREWRENRNHVNSQEQCPSMLLEEPRPDRLNYWLSQFVVEARHKDGKRHICRHRSTVFPVHTRNVCLNFMNRKDVIFCELTASQIS